MRGRIVYSLMVIALLWACEDPNTLSVSRAFSGNNLQTIYCDTFSVFTSTVQLDTFLTNNTGTVLVGNYHDNILGNIYASSYFQLLPFTGSASSSAPFAPDFTSVFDSMVLVMNYNHIFSGDTTKPITIRGYQLSEPMMMQNSPVGSVKYSAFNNGAGFFNTSSFQCFPNPLFTGTFKIFPHTDSVSIRIPDALGLKWFTIAQNDSADIFQNPPNPNLTINPNVQAINFVRTFFYGLRLDADPSALSSVVGFDASKLKIRIYYKQTNASGLLTRTHWDFKICSYYPNQNNYQVSTATPTLNQFNNIRVDRSGTLFASLQTSQRVSSTSPSSNNTSFIQAGTGLVTRLDFPSLKPFFANQPSYILNAANLVVQPEQGSYPKNFLPPKQIQLYTTDPSNTPLSTISGGVAGITYDYEYGINTQYVFQLFPFLFNEIKSGTDYITPLILAASGSQGNSVQRLYIGDRFHPTTKIKLQIIYSYADN